MKRDIPQCLLAVIGGIICGLMYSVLTDNSPILVGLIAYGYLRTIFALNGIQRKLDSMEQEKEAEE